MSKRTVEYENNWEEESSIQSHPSYTSIDDISKTSIPFNNGAPAKVSKFNNGESNLQEVATTFAGSNGNNGAMFDISIRKGNSSTEIISLDIHTNLIEKDCPIVVYGRLGTHLGFENATESWTLLVNTTTDCKGFGSRTHVPPFVNPPVLRGGEIYSFYTYMPSPSIRYITGFEIGDIFASDGFLNIHEGTGVAKLFGGHKQKFLSPRRWNGVISYNIVNNDSSINFDTCNEKLTTTFDDNLGSFGNMFDVVTQDSKVEVYGLDFYTDLYEAVSYEIFTRIDSFENGKLPKEPAILNALGRDPKNVDRMKLLNWKLVKKGKTIGRGFGMGTPVRGFTPFVISPNSVQGFYVTLTTPDIRYRNVTIDILDTKVGQKYSSSKDLEIHLGVSVGTYPAGKTFYGPRAWSGSLLYTADRVCETESPSLVPSNAPTQSPSHVLSAVPSLSAEELGGCTSIATLETTMSGATGSYGNIFTITAKEQISIISMDINVGSTNEVEIEIYTKAGDYKGFEDKRKSWNLVARVNVIGSGDGKVTIIGDDDFDDIHMRPDETRSLYVTLNSPDIKYSRTNTRLGETLFHDSMLSINVGAGLASQAFAKDVLAFEPRKFNGALHYKYVDDCAIEISTTFPFLCDLRYDPDSTNRREKLDTINAVVERSLDKLVKNDKDLRKLANKYNFKFFRSKTFIVVPDCSEISAVESCSTVESNATFLHKSTLEQEDVQFALLKHVEYISDELRQANIVCSYTGDKPVNTEVVISLEGYFNEILTEAEMEYFVVTTLLYLKEYLGDLGITIHNAAIADHFNTKRRILINDDDSVNSQNSLDIPIVIDGSYRPPPEVDFLSVVSDAINAEDGTTYKDDLVNGRRDVPEEIKEQMGTFHLVTEVEIESYSQYLNSATEYKENPLITILAGGLGGIVVLFCVLLFCYFRRKTKKGSGSSQLVKMESKYFDDKTSHVILEDAKCIHVEPSNAYMGLQSQQQIEDDFTTGASTAYTTAGNASYSTWPVSPSTRNLHAGGFTRSSSYNSNRAFSLAPQPSHHEHGDNMDPNWASQSIGSFTDVQY